jgi:hypothetical protein
MKSALTAALSGAPQTNGIPQKNPQKGLDPSAFPCIDESKPSDPNDLDFKKLTFGQESKGFLAGSAPTVKRLGGGAFTVSIHCA